MGTPSIDDALHTEDHPAFARGSDTRHLAGDVLQFPVSSEVSTKRIANNENLISRAAEIGGVSKDTARAAMHRTYGSGQILKLPGVD